MAVIWGDVNRHVARKELDRAQGLEQRAAAFICKTFGINPGRSPKDPEFGFEWLRTEFGFPGVLSAVRVRWNLAALFKDLLKTPLFKAYAAAAVEHGAWAFGLVTPAAAGSALYILHGWRLNPASGSARLWWPGLGGGDLIFETLPDFLAALRDNGWSP